MDIKICPCCEQGNLYYYQHPKILTKFIFCDECEALWFNQSSISSIPDNNFENFLFQQGITNITEMWADIWLNENWCNNPVYDN
ncbi:hypothetical protein [Wielerella bovis]|uniref:hypothetical protein n=1 Tax=Wielerella bovis TaxID=2917790 RepID=UPI002019DFC8|nr:hypothetical protein [Wielerella bovis]MCG7656567.1 hypothetical protein [Wielerella bovis]MCG7658792.1 hypothetical protein [Wielerella bovis]